MSDEETYKCIPCTDAVVHGKEGERGQEEGEGYTELTACAARNEVGRWGEVLSITFQVSLVLNNIRVSELLFRQFRFYL